jgi:pimeloyl-ACP methyl ester carboxylesterase
VLKQLERLPIAPEDAEKGLNYEIFEQYAPGSKAGSPRVPVARILAFLGTDTSSLTDIFYGILRDDQIESANRYFEAEHKRWGSDPQWIVTGHSLGGALATEVSVRHPEVRAYMLNTSPFYRSAAETNALERTVFNEPGEVLRRFARYDIAPAANIFTINCEPRKNAITRHKVRPLADCITWIAAYADADALAVVKANGIVKPFVECERSNPVHPGISARRTLPCIQSGRPEEDRAAIEPRAPSR